MPSLTFLYASACEITRAADVGKSMFVYQFGDHDPSCVLTPLTIQRRPTESSKRLDCPPRIVERPR
jgi:hypothetical protein